MTAGAAPSAVVIDVSSCRRIHHRRRYEPRRASASATATHLSPPRYLPRSVAHRICRGRLRPVYRYRLVFPPAPGLPAVDSETAMIASDRPYHVGETIEFQGTL